MEDGGIIPVPISVSPSEGALHLWNAVAINVRGECGGVGQLLAAFLQERLALAVQTPQQQVQALPQRMSLVIAVQPIPPDPLVMFHTRPQLPSG